MSRARPGRAAPPPAPRGTARLAQAPRVRGPPSPKHSPPAMVRSARYLYPQAGSRAWRSCARSSPSVGSAPCTSSGAVRFCSRTRSFIAAAAAGIRARLASPRAGPAGWPRWRRWRRAAGARAAGACRCFGWRGPAPARPRLPGARGLLSVRRRPRARSVTLSAAPWSVRQRSMIGCSGCARACAVRCLTPPPAIFAWG